MTREKFFESISGLPIDERALAQYISDLVDEDPEIIEDDDIDQIYRYAYQFLNAWDRFIGELEQQEVELG